ncbi:MAG: hypothetical protein OJI67_08595 [Prosthecobacter sp.]|nr:hypothetical protein [Prosthecobacter sp.]
MKAKTIKTDLGELIAGFNDTVNGEKITKSSAVLGTHATDVTMTHHDGKQHQLLVIHCMGGSIAIQSKHRGFRFSLEALVNHAVEAGVLAESIDFKERC